MRRRAFITFVIAAWRRVRQRVKQLMPTHLLSRTLLILCIPALLSQGVAAYIFYSRHWESVLRHMALAAASDMTVLVREYHFMKEEQGPKAARMRMWRMGQALSIGIHFEGGPLPLQQLGTGQDAFPQFYKNLSSRIREPFSVTVQEDQVVIRMRLDSQHVTFRMDRKRLLSSTTTIFMGWMLGSSLLLIAIAALFLRNQIRPVVQLAHVAEQLGLGQEVADFSPRGANEVRRAGKAFLTMAERLRRQMSARTTMLAGISHDLRTPLTRMKLELEMGGVSPATASAINQDIDQMTHMIDGYLAFARGDAGEAMQAVALPPFFEALCAPYARQGASVAVLECPDITLFWRPHAMQRALTNLIENGLRYGGGRVEIRVDASSTFVRIKVRDHGAGIPPHLQEEVLKPFTRLEHSRNLATGGVGLGLSIAQDSVQHHGGSMTLENLADATGAVTGLEVTLRLPRALHPVPR